jgi:hypothetical protein
MQNSYFLPDNVNAHIHRPACPKWHAFMMLARITPARVGFDFRWFECPRCAHAHEVMVAPKHSDDHSRHMHRRTGHGTRNSKST